MKYYILSMVIIVIVVVGLNVLFKKYLYPKVNVNKWIVLLVGALVLVVPFILDGFGVFKLNSIISSVQAGIASMAVLWFYEIVVNEKISTKNKAKTKISTEIKPKAKPNRLKNTDMEVIHIKDAAKKRKNKKNKKNKKK